MTNMVSTGFTEAQSRQLEAEARVYVPDVYDPALGDSLGREVDELFCFVRSRTENLGERLRNSERLVPDGRHPNLLVVLGAIGILTASIDRGIWPSQPGTHTLLQVIDMTPVVPFVIRDGEISNSAATPVYGSWHTDRKDIKGLVAIATYQGVSRLKFKDGVTYDLLPGGVAIVDNERPLWHRGKSTVRRRAIGLANIAGEL